MPLTPTDAATMVRAVVDEVGKAIVGKRPIIELIMAGLLADGHVLLDDVPGVAKTLTARSIATAAGLSFSRVQFTPDLLPADITGSTVLDLATREARFRPGPIFASLVLADEINRAPAKTQSALLEAMQERQTTADGVAHALPTPVPRDRHAEPDRVGGHLPAARGAARPVHPAHDDRPARPRRRARDRPPTAGPWRGRGRPATRARPGPLPARSSSRWSGWRWTR